MKVLYKAYWDLWDDDSEEEWWSTLLVDCCSVCVRCEDGVVFVNGVYKQDGVLRASAEAYEDVENLHETPEEAVLAYAESDVEYDRKHLEKSEKVLAYVKDKIAKGEKP